MDDAIVGAVRALLAEQGYSQMTVDAVASRAGVGKAAIYRRYATKQEMTFTVLLHGLHDEAPGDTGSLRGDLERLTTRIAAQLARSSSDAMIGLLADVRADPVLDKRFEETYLAAERSILTVLLDRAVARGELSQRPDVRSVHVLLLGPLFAWLIMLDEDPSLVPDLARHVARIVGDALVGGNLSTGAG